MIWAEKQGTREWKNLFDPKKNKLLTSQFKEYSEHPGSNIVYFCYFAENSFFDAFTLPEGRKSVISGDLLVGPYENEFLGLGQAGRMVTTRTELLPHDSEQLPFKPTI